MPTSKHNTYTMAMMNLSLASLQLDSQLPNLVKLLVTGATPDMEEEIDHLVWQLTVNSNKRATKCMFKPLNLQTSQEIILIILILEASILKTTRSPFLEGGPKIVEHLLSTTLPTYQVPIQANLLALSEN